MMRKACFLLVILPWVLHSYAAAHIQGVLSVDNKFFKKNDNTLRALVHYYFAQKQNGKMHKYPEVAILSPIALMKQQEQLQSHNIISVYDLNRPLFAGGITAFCFIIIGLVYRHYITSKRYKAIIAEAHIKINSQNEVLISLMQEKEWLVKEIHHRVKNNLQIVISLLNTQSAYLHNEDALDAISNSKHRMQTMSLIHQKLYQHDGLSTIDMAVYIRELVEYLSESYGKANDVIINFDVCTVRLDVSQAVPLGLIINEAISNSIKFAFANTKSGCINVLLQETEDGRYRLCIADTGSGLANDFDVNNTSSLGMSLMLGLTQQLDGEFFLENNGGLQICILFKPVKFNNLEIPYPDWV